MPQATSAAKSRNAQEARRQAAQRSAANRRSRPKRPAANTPASSVISETKVMQSESSIDNSDTLLSEKDLLDGTQSSQVIEATATEAEVDQLCELIESDPTALGPKSNSVRQLCRNRREALSTRGKAAVPSGGNTARMGMMAFSKSSSRGRDFARQRRVEKATIGRGSKPKARPSRPPRKLAAPPKVEIGTTLSGQPVSGTQVERNATVTGSEQGTCLPITGTEYIGSEQFNDFCGAQPEPNAPKVGMSVTGAGRPVSGTEVGRSEKVTGDEQGSCVNVTGSEYVGAEKLSGFCGTKPTPTPSKVVVGSTEKKQIRVSGSDEARLNGMTGSEAGANQKVTGSQYSDAGAAKMTINGPSKVALTHTIAGQPVTGTEVGRSAKVTGDEYGATRPISGTEYLSNEQFESVYGTAGQPHPAKVGVDNSEQGQRITGALVDRTEKVTGNEPGSCAHLTGSQYGQSKLCGGVAPKVHEMQTLSGGNLTGNAVGYSPKMTGDEQEGCQPITGIEYYGQEQFAACPSTPSAQPQKVGVEHTPKGQHVSGTMVNEAENVTGNEMGAQLAVSGTPYAGVQAPANHGSCCDACAIKDAAKAAGIVAQTQVVAAPQYQVQQAVPVAVPLHSEIAKHPQKITGEGREDGISVTGDNWGRSPGMTGTEGHIVKSRNPSLKAQEQHQPVNNAHDNKVLELPDPEVAKVTGSSGNFSQGAVITVSGGARG
ncbi:MAG: CsoS2 family carboxysome shell protein [bacterium]